MRSVLKAAFRAAGFEIRRVADDFVLPVEFTKREVEIFDYVWNNRLTMELKTGLTAAMLAAKHAVEADIPGDWVECGVWRGGVSLAAKLIFEEHRSAKSAWLFDTFAGMTEPGEHDRPKFEKYDTQNTFEQQQREDYNEWCHASVEDVRKNFERAGADLNGVHLVKGDVAETLADAANLPQQICVLRLDTDFYKGTRTELEILYPRLSLGGPILIGDVGYWEGVKRAVDEYFVDPRTRPLLYYTDLSDRMGVKVS